MSPDNLIAPAACLLKGMDSSFACFQVCISFIQVFLPKHILQVKGLLHITFVQQPPTVLCNLPSTLGLHFNPRISCVT